MFEMYNMIVCVASRSFTFILYSTIPIVLLICDTLYKVVVAKLEHVKCNKSEANRHLSHME